MWGRRVVKRTRRAKKKIEWVEATDIKDRIDRLVTDLDLHYIDSSKIFTIRSENAHTRAYARIWGLSRVFQLALKIGPAYVIEVIAEKFDQVSPSEQDKILIHELVHIPQTFSGSLSPHTRRRAGRPGFEDKVHHLVDKLERLK